VSDTRFDDFLKTQRPVYEAAEESFRTPVEQNVNLTMV
jgi:hypothetical protein